MSRVVTSLSAVSTAEAPVQRKEKEGKPGMLRSPEAEDQEKKGPNAQGSSVEVPRTSLQQPPKLSPQEVAHPTPRSQMDASLETSSTAQGNPSRQQRNSSQNQPPEAPTQTQVESGLPEAAASEDPFLLSSLTTSSKELAPAPEPAAPPTADARPSTAAQKEPLQSLHPSQRRSSDCELPKKDSALLQGPEPRWHFGKLYNLPSRLLQSTYP